MEIRKWYIDRKKRALLSHTKTCFSYVKIKNDLCQRYKPIIWESCPESYILQLRYNVAYPTIQENKKSRSCTDRKFNDKFQSRFNNESFLRAYLLFTLRGSSNFPRLNLHRSRKGKKGWIYHTGQSYRNFHFAASLNHRPGEKVTSEYWIA